MKGALTLTDVLALSGCTLWRRVLSPWQEEDMKKASELLRRRGGGLMSEKERDLEANGEDVREVLKRALPEAAPQEEAR